MSLSAYRVHQEPDHSAPALVLAPRAGLASQQQPGHIAEEGCRQLIEKLAASGQLKAGFLVRVLQQGQIELFELGFAHLLGTGRIQLGRILYEGGPRLLALACHAAGIDRAVFPTVYSLSRRSRRMPHLLEANERLDAIAIFETHSRQEALALLLAV